MTRRTRIFVWSLSLLLALFFALQGASKFLGRPAEQWRQRFVAWGYPAGFQYVIGAVELVAGIALLVPKGRRVAACCLMIVMAGALVTHLLHGELARIIPPIVLGSCVLLLFLKAKPETG